MKKLKLESNEILAGYVLSVAGDFYDGEGDFVAFDEGPKHYSDDEVAKAKKECETETGAEEVDVIAIILRTVD